MSSTKQACRSACKITAATAAAVLSVALFLASCGEQRGVDLSGIAETPQDESEFDHSHSRWSGILAGSVKDGTVDYEALHKDPSGLKDYLDSLERVTKAPYASWTEDQKLAFWLNAYNAYTVKVILDHYPLKSIRDIGSWRSVFNMKLVPLVLLFGEKASLNNIEHDVIRKEFAEPRIHFALVCASKGCPPLRSEAYRAEDLDRQLQDQTRTFLRTEKWNRWDPASKTLHLSKIFDWYGEDFVKAEGSVHKFVSKHLDVPADARIQFLDYDWTLNGR